MENVDSHQHFLFTRPLRAFLEAMQGARDLEVFISANVRNLNNVELQFTEEATRRFPDAPKEQHSKAATIILDNVRQTVKERKELTENGASDEEIVKIKGDLDDRLRAQLISLTGKPEYYHLYAIVWTAVNSRRGGAMTLRASLLMSVISDFEVLVAALVRAVLEIHPEILRSNDAKFSMEDIENFHSIDEFRRHCAEKMADGLLRKGFDDWMQWFRKLKLSVPGVTDCPVELIEIFQRRHLLVHAGGVVNESYLAKVGSIVDRPKVGDILHVNKDYLRKSIDILMSSAAKLSSGAAMKFVSSEGAKERIDRSIYLVSYDLLLRKEYSVVEKLNEWHLGFLEDADDRLVSTVNLWLSKKKLYGIEAIKTSVEEWDVKSLAKRYLLVKLALLDIDEEAYKLAMKMLESEELTVESWRRWPVLENVRAYESSLGGEPIGGERWLFESPLDRGVGEEEAVTRENPDAEEG
ncbi:hypothetical protein [Nocardia nova]